jgi:hypothetical protein
LSAQATEAGELFPPQAIYSQGTGKTVVTAANDTGIRVLFAHLRVHGSAVQMKIPIGLTRQYCPKGTDFSNVSYHMIMKSQDRLNGRPGKTTGVEDTL